MKWNDRNLPYSGENKQIIYNYILSTMKRMKDKYPSSTLTSVFIMNFILNDIYYDTKVFKTKDKHTWFLNELKNNPFLFDFIVAETNKMKDMPNIFADVDFDYADIENKKTDAFASVVQEYIMKHPEIPHLYFSSLDNDDIKVNVRDFVKKNYRSYKYKRSTLEYKYEKMLKIKLLLERDIDIKTEFVPPDRKILLLNDINNMFDVCIFEWGNFPIVPKYPQKDILLCMADDISVRVFGFISPMAIKENSNDEFLFMEDKPETLKNFTALAKFNDELFKKEVI